MKNIAFKILMLSLVAAAATACTSDMKYNDYDVYAPAGLTSPANDYYIELVAGDGQFVFFQWEPARTESGITPSYEIVFYKTQGGPEIFRYDAGLNAYAYVSHKNMNKIADLADIDAESEGGDLYWSVIASLATKEERAEETWKLAIKRLAGFSYIPPTLYLVGSATEAGSLGVEKLEMRTLDEEGEFEIYTRLDANGTYNIIDDQDTYYTYTNRIMELGDAPISINETGEYRVFVDMTTKSIKWKGITAVEYHLQHMLSENQVLEYVGNGVWMAPQKLIQFAPASWGWDERFRFQVQVTGEDYDLEVWGAAEDDTPQRPGSWGEKPEYWNISFRLDSETSDRYQYCWKWPDDYKDRIVDLKVVMTATEKDYHIEAN